MRALDYIRFQMTAKTTQVSVRVSDEDAAFLAQGEPSGTTPSERLRQLIAQARAQQEQGGTYEGALLQVRALLEPVSQALRTREMASLQRSEMIADTLYWLPDVVAYLISGPKALGECEAPASLIGFEAGVAQRVFRFMDAMLRLAVTSKVPCYDPNVVAAHMGGTLELARLVLDQHQKTPAAPLSAQEH